METKEDILEKYCGDTLSMLSKEKHFKQQILNAMKEFADQEREDIKQWLIGEDFEGLAERLP